MQRRRVILAAGNKRSRLPKEYQEVEYLKSTGTQYINPIVYASELNKITAVFHTDDLSQRRCYVFGSVKTVGGESDRNQFSYIFKNSSTAGFGWGNKFYDQMTVCTTAKHTISVNSGTFTLDGVKIFQFSSNEFSGLQQIALFGCFVDNSIAHTDKLSIYSATIDNGANRLRELIPCYRKADHKPGMYDLVTKTFFTNSGTGEFLVGPNVN